MEIEASHLGRNFSPGQFVMVKLQEKVYNPLLRIPLGVHVIREKRIKLLYKVVGSGTRLLSEKLKNEKVDILGPLGKGFDLNLISGNKKFHAIIVAGGRGIAPLYAVAETILKKKSKVDVFIGANTKKHVLCHRELKKLGAKVHVATEDGTIGHKGLVTDLVLRHFKQLSTNDYRLSTIYACGPKPMLAAVVKETKKYNIPVQVSLDEYMACGIGACLGCAVRVEPCGYKLVCEDGPVFDAREIRWQI